MLCLIFSECQSRSSNDGAFLLRDQVWQPVGHRFDSQYHESSAYEISFHHCTLDHST